MKVLYMDLNAAYPQGVAGGHRSTHGLLARFAAQPGCAAMALAPRRGQGAQYPEYDPLPEEYESLGIGNVEKCDDKYIYHCGYPVWSVDDIDTSIGTAMDAFQPDIVYCHSFVSMPLLEKARAKNLGAIWYLRDTRITAPAMQQARSIGVELIAVSRFLGERARQAECKVTDIYSMIEAQDYQVQPEENGYVTFINPHPLKGLETFLAFAARLPQIPFLVVEAWPLGPEMEHLQQRLAPLPNVTFLPQQADVRDIYRQTRILVVPSIVEEGGPRVAREAQISGIPVIASGNGGNREVIGDGGILIDEFEDAQVWAEAIEQLWTDRALYDALSNQALLHVKRPEFQPDNILEKFTRVCEQAIHAG